MLLLFAVCGCSLYAQSNAFLDEFLEIEQAPLGDTIRLTLTAARAIPENGSTDQALAVIENKGWSIDTADNARPVSLGTFCYLLMRSFNIPGGIMYRIFPGPRYAARELDYLGMIPGSTNPARSVSGEEVIRMLGTVLDWQERQP